jgi:hypothetical protein
MNIMLQGEVPALIIVISYNYKKNNVEDLRTFNFRAILSATYF